MANGTSYQGSNSGERALNIVNGVEETLLYLFEDYDLHPLAVAGQPMSPPFRRYARSAARPTLPNR